MIIRRISVGFIFLFLVNGGWGLLVVVVLLVVDIVVSDIVVFRLRLGKEVSSVVVVELVLRDLRGGLWDWRVEAVSMGVGDEFLLCSVIIFE